MVVEEVVVVVVEEEEEVIEEVEEVVEEGFVMPIKKETVVEALHVNSPIIKS